ncbi:splicing factor SF2 [Besnoitia besnoiti]|uniref:Splicing factor SF2 n=1 Tax=Besnoitia besnoiti TaxID=94643 RepID=A0A2A9MLA7_BESBE|nr:splicing factor SF2 [Besnoitia besnoiti]PFH36240.1 splicing factor SF2 [Besnoitia besnoiti]
MSRPSPSPRRGRSSSAPRQGSRIFVANLPLDVTESEVEDLFYKFGKIEDIELRRDRAADSTIAFVQFADYKAADEAIDGRDGTRLGFHRIRIERARQRLRRSGDFGRERGWGSGGRDGGGTAYGPPRRSEFRVNVFGLPSTASWQDLKDHMRRAGDVGYANIEGGVGVVEYSNADDMDYALRKLHGSLFRNIFHTAKIRVERDAGDDYAPARRRPSPGRDRDRQVDFSRDQASKFLSRYRGSRSPRRARGYSPGEFSSPERRRAEEDRGRRRNEASSLEAERQRRRKADGGEEELRRRRRDSVEGDRQKGRADTRRRDAKSYAAEEAEDRRRREAKSYSDEEDERRGKNSKSYSDEADEGRGKRVKSYANEENERRGKSAKSYSDEEDERRGKSAKSYSDEEDERRGKSAQTYSDEEDECRGKEAKTYVEEDDERRRDAKGYSDEDGESRGDRRGVGDAEARRRRAPRNASDEEDGSRRVAGGPSSDEGDPRKCSRGLRPDEEEDRRGGDLKGCSDEEEDRERRGSCHSPSRSGSAALRRSSGSSPRDARDCTESVQRRQERSREELRGEGRGREKLSSSRSPSRGYRARYGYKRAREDEEDVIRRRPRQGDIDGENARENGRRRDEPRDLDDGCREVRTD